MASRVSDDSEQLALAERIRDARAALGLTQQQVADASGIDRVALANVELGRRRINVLELRHLARTLSTTMAVLLDHPDRDAVPATAVTRLVVGLTPAQIGHLTTYAQFLLWLHNRAEPAEIELGEQEPEMPDDRVSAHQHDDEPMLRPEVTAVMAVDDSAKSMAAAHGAVMAAESAVGTQRIHQLRDEQSSAMKRWQAAQQELADAREAGDPAAIQAAGVAEAKTYRDFMLLSESCVTEGLAINRVLGDALGKQLDLLRQCDTTHVTVMDTLRDTNPEADGSRHPG
ncbi:helix-turn-helix domain-containing protein [Amycolatopsis saalfeldensis]|uniref:Transcriptional regulator, contains XRE-family HTH domain n=1 Tax=Amycolatopsis saalfeldensis TaxID=394193 RepID=A0A1H8YN25_9PSEU|nr:helix-turn-helix domain-containing protein [Amycolatopsis saalfeldensis]SEP53587.1 Transcriptional regulator, contains XRE-family HTH domain [Amycolatopsis saalfeldensis]